MPKSNIKIELKKLIDNELDDTILNEIKALLNKANLNPILKEKLSNRAQNSEHNITEGKIFTPEEMHSKTKCYLGK